MWVEYNYSSVELERMSKQPTHTFLTCVVRSGGRGGRTKEQTPSPLLGNLNKKRVSTHTWPTIYISASYYDYHSIPHGENVEHLTIHRCWGASRWHICFFYFWGGTLALVLISWLRAKAACVCLRLSLIHSINTVSLTNTDMFFAWAYV